MMSQQDCVMILSSDNDDVQVVENASDPPERLNGENPIDKKRIPIQSTVTGKEIFEQFLDKCRSLDPSKDMEIIIKKIWKKFNEASKEYVSSHDFIALVREAITNISEGPYAQMKIVSDNLKHNKKVQTESKAKNASSSTSAEAIQNENEEEIDPKTLSHIKRLEKTLKKLHLRIQKLENDEVDLSSSDDDNSAYIQLSRYKQRICEVFKKLCELQNKDPYAERSYKKRIKFNGTNVPAVNKAIEKFYNDTKEFPDYKNILNVVQKANEVKKLNLLPHEVDALAVKAFLEFGKTLKSWRQFDDYECFHLYEKNEKDPASEDEVLKTRLEENKKKYANRIDEVIDKYALKQDEENLQPEVVNSDAKSSESEDEEEEDAESDCRSRISILEWKYNPDDSSDDSDKEIKNDINCKVVLVDVKCTPEWDKYMKRIENANIKDETNKTTTNLHSVDLENKPPWLTHKRNLSSDDESPSSKKIKTVVSLEQIPSTSKQTVPILLEDFRHVSKTTDEHRFNNKTAKNTAKAVINQNSPKSSIELQMSVDEEDDNDVIEIVSDSCDRASNENENINPCNEPKEAKNHQSSPSSSKNNNEESKNEAKAEDAPSAALDELINIEDSETKADTPTPLPKNQHSNADICADGSATESNASPRKPSDDVICVEDAEDKNQSNEPAINELSVNIISIDVSSEESKKNNNIHDIPISQSLDNVINVEECVVDNEENQSQEALIDMPLDVIITADPLAENPVSPAPNDDSSPSNVSKEEENNPSNVDNSESAAITQDSKKKTTLDKDDKLDTESTVKKPHNDKPISDEKAQPVKDNEDEIMIIDEVVKTKTPEKPVNKNDEVIDVEELSDSPQPKKFKQLTLDLSPINLTQIIRNMNFEKNVNKQNPRPRMPAPSTSFGINNARRNDVRNTRINNTVRESMICNQGTSKLTPYNHSQPSFNSKNLNSRQQLALMPSNQRVKMMNNQLGFNKNIGQPSNNRNVTGQTAQAAMHKRQCTTTHTLQRFDNKNNCMVTRKQVTTVVEESVVKISNSQTASNGNFHMVGQRTRVVNRRMQQIQKSTRPPNRGSTSQEIITLD